MNSSECILFSGGAPGAEAEFGACAERHGVEEVYQVNHGQEIYVIGAILDDGTVRGGTGWGAEFAKLCNKPLFVFDQDKDGWFEWTADTWTRRGGADGPVITHPHFTGTGTRTPKPNAVKAIEELLTRSFGA